MKTILRTLLPTLAVGILVTPLAAQSVVRPAPRAHTVAQGAIRGTMHYSHPVAPQPYFKPVNPIPRPGIMPAYVNPPSAYGPAPMGYGVYPNVRYFTRRGHVYAHDFTTNETYLVQW